MGHAVWPNYKPHITHHKHRRRMVKPFSEGVFKQTKVRVVDNSKIGMEAMSLGRPPKVIQVYTKRHLRGPNGPYGILGDKVKVAIMGEMRLGIIVGMKCKQPHGIPVYDTNNIVLISEDGSPLGTFSRHEEEVVINQLLSDFLVHASQSVVVTGKIASEFWESVLHEVFNSNTLVLGDSRGQTESLDGSSNTNSDRVNWDIRANVSLDFFNVHVGNMFEASGETMVFADEWVKDISKVKVGVFVTSIDTAMLVVEFNCDSDSLCQSESRGLCDDSGKFVPFLFGDVL